VDKDLEGDGHDLFEGTIQIFSIEAEGTTEYITKARRCSSRDSYLVLLQCQSRPLTLSQSARYW
jgi:hypothetical protein